MKRHTFYSETVEFENYFSFTQLLSLLCMKRAVAAKKQHDVHFIRNITKGGSSPHTSNQILSHLFPPRYEWIRLTENERRIKKFNSIQINATQIERTILRFKKKVDKGLIASPAWLMNLTEFIDDIRKSAFKDNEYTLPSPDIRPVIKNKSKKEFRPICLFKIKDAIIIGQTAKYLTFCFDRLFCSNSYAFRHKQANSSIIYNHHKAIEDVLSYRQEHKGDLYVAECDIKKFFDSICHKTVKSGFLSSEFDLKLFHDISIHIQAKNLFFQYLKCFTYTHNVYQQEQKILRKYGHRNATIPWLEKQDFSKVDLDKEIDDIGVPQGGALSCLIANLILNQIDRQLLSLNDGNMFYARFCDDMVLIHPNKEVCSSLFEFYQTELSRLKLSYHQPQSQENYGKLHWQNKSKDPYKWAEIVKSDSSTYCNVPWLSFVGYQVRHEGTIRVRKGSIEKELKKQVAETDKIIKSVNKVGYTNINRKSVTFRLHQRLVSMSIGKVDNGEFSPSMCWAAGFKVLFKKAIIATQIKKLDRNRERQIIRIFNYTGTIMTNENRKGNLLKREIRFGYKYSYYKRVR